MDRVRHLTFAVPQGQQEDDELAVDSTDPIKAGLDAVNLRLCRPTFLHNLTASRLPSQAASEASASPGPDRLSFSAPEAHKDHGELKVPDASHPFSDLDKLDAALVLTVDWPDNSTPQQLNHRVCAQLEASFLRAHRAFSKMQATDRGFQTFAHGHQDLVLAVDYNYYGTRMVTASSDHRLKVWDRKDDNWTIVDSWRAHDAEIVDVSVTL